MSRVISLHGNSCESCDRPPCIDSLSIRDHGAKTARMESARSSQRLTSRPDSFPSSSQRVPDMLSAIFLAASIAAIPVTDLDPPVFMPPPVTRIVGSILVNCAPSDVIVINGQTMSSKGAARRFDSAFSGDHVVTVRTSTGSVTWTVKVTDGTTTILPPGSSLLPSSPYQPAPNQGGWPSGGGGSVPQPAPVPMPVPTRGGCPNGRCPFVR